LAAANFVLMEQVRQWLVQWFGASFGGKSEKSLTDVLEQLGNDLQNVVYSEDAQAEDSRSSFWDLFPGIDGDIGEQMEIDEIQNRKDLLKYLFERPLSFFMKYDREFTSNKQSKREGNEKRKRKVAIELAYRMASTAKKQTVIQATLTLIKQSSSAVMDEMDTGLGTKKKLIQPVGEKSPVWPSVVASATQLVFSLLSFEGVAQILAKGASNTELVGNGKLPAL
jgi:hypothetical protein